MTYGGVPYAGGPYAGGHMVAADIPADTDTHLAVEVAFTTGALDEPVWVDITADVRSWETSRGRYRELERFQPGRATIVLGNLSRQYDSVYAAGPHYGNIKPMKRVRIRETFSGVTYPVFDGYVDKWVLDYPGTGHDATATIIATDGFKILARTDLPKSVYEYEVDTDAPIILWRLDDTIEQVEDERVALNRGSGGSALDGTYVGSPRASSLPVVVNDSSTSLATVSSVQEDNADFMGVEIDSATFSLLSTYESFALEAWCRPQPTDLQEHLFFYAMGANPSHMSAALVGGQRIFQARVRNNVGGLAAINSDGYPDGLRFHVVMKVGPAKLLTLWVNGEQAATTATVTGTLDAADLLVAHEVTFTSNNWYGDLGYMGVYTGALGTDPLPAARIQAHYAAGTHPWQDDLPGVRIGRILDIVEWPATRREIDPGLTALQSATLNTPALDHLQKVAETEFGLLFVDRTGKVRFVDRTAVFARTPKPEIYGDDTGEVGYRGFVPDDGDEVIRNRALISRLNGAIRMAVDAASVTEFGRFDYTLDGLYHRLETYSQAYGDFIVAEYSEPRRRITSLDMGPAIVGDEDIVYPAMLARELGDAITVRSRPVGGGATFEQVCVIEGIEHAGAPGGVRTARFILSPELQGVIF